MVYTTSHINEAISLFLCVCFSLMVDDIKPEQPDINKLVKFADDMTVCAPVISNSYSATQEVRNTENWASRNRITLILSNTWEMLFFKFDSQCHNNNFIIY